jgi:hypothetical protein
LLRTQTIEGELQYLDPRRVARLLADEKFLSPHGKAEARDGNVLRLTERIGRVRRVAQLVHRLDVEDLGEADEATLVAAARSAWREGAAH